MLAETFLYTPMNPIQFGVRNGRNSYLNVSVEVMEQTKQGWIGQNFALKDVTREGVSVGHLGVSLVTVSLVTVLLFF